MAAKPELFFFKSRDLNRNSSRNKNETMFGNGYENCPEFGVLGGIVNRKKNYCSSGAFQVAPASYYIAAKVRDN
jgi:hypothetical protein